MDRNGAQYRERLFLPSTFTGSRSALECAFAPSNPSPLLHPAQSSNEGPSGPRLLHRSPRSRSFSLSLSLSRHSKLDRRFRSEAASVRPTHSPSGPRWDSLDRVDRLALLNARLRPDIKFANILQVSFVLSS